MWVDNPKPDKIGMFLMEVMHLNLLSYQIVVILTLDLPAVQVDHSGYDNYLLPYAYGYFALLQLPVLNKNVHQGEGKELTACWVWGLGNGWV